MARLWNAQEDIRSLKSLILFGVRGMAAYAHHALVLGYTDEAVNDFFAKALFAVGEDWGMEELLPIVMEVGEKNLKCMAAFGSGKYRKLWHACACYRSADCGKGAVYCDFRSRSA